MAKFYTFIMIILLSGRVFGQENKDEMVNSIRNYLEDAIENLDHRDIGKFLSYYKEDTRVKDIIEELPVGLPVRNVKINSKYGRRMHPVMNKVMMHNGVDLQASHGEPVLSTGKGVVKTGFSAYNGLYVKIVHSIGFESIYCHLDEIKVSTGDSVNREDILGYVGNTGLSKGAHLHYAIKWRDKYFNPEILLNEFKER